MKIKTKEYSDLHIDPATPMTSTLKNNNDDDDDRTMTEVN